MRRRYNKPVDIDERITSREYKLFEQEELQSSLPQTLYEKSARFAGKMNIAPDKKSSGKIQASIDFAHLKIRPADVSSITVMFILITLVPVILLSVLGMIGYAILILMIALPFSYYLYIFPDLLKKKYEITTGSEIVTSVLYMALYMRNNQNLEGAVRFAADNVSGNMAYELRKLLWDVEVGNFVSIKDGLMALTNKWSNNREFNEAIELMFTSLSQTGDRRLQTIDEAVDIVLEGSRENAKHFNQNLKMPVLIVNAMGIILPVMGLVLFPVISIFLNVGAIFLFIGYDILLPIVLFFIISTIIETRPVTYSKIDISDNPDVPPEGRFRSGKQFISAWPITLAVTILLSGIGTFMYVFNSGLPEPSSNLEILSGMLIAGGFSIGLGTHFRLLSKDRIKIRDDTRKVEEEFAESLFQIGNQVGGGVPIELSMENSLKRMGTAKIKDMFIRAINNIKTMGMTFSQAFFDRQYGAIRYYPSRIVRSVMRTIVESSKKGVESASLAMLSISRYMKGVHKTQEEVTEELNDTVNSLKFQAYFLGPLVSGVITTLAIIIIQILAGLQQQASSFGNISVLPQLGATGISTFQFVMVVAIYILEVSFILAYFISGIENGNDKIGFQNVLGNILLTGFTMFAVVFFLTLLVFGPLVSALV